MSNTMHACSDVCVEKDIFCEPCGPTVAGGYDETKKQVANFCRCHVVWQK